MQNGQFFRRIFLCVAISFVGAISSVLLLAQPVKKLSEQERLSIALEALSRIDSKLEGNPKLKTAIYDLLPRVRGTAYFVELVKKFQLKDQNAGLLEVAIANPSSEAGVEATRMIFANNDLAQFKNALASTNISGATKTAEALGNAGEKSAAPLLLPLVKDAHRDMNLRRQAVRSLARTQEGANDLLKMARENDLPNDLKFTATTELNSVRWPKIKTEAAKILPLPQGQNEKAIPTISELMKINGNAANGEKVFFRTETACASCHKIKGQGGDVGPNLSEIGTKLGKDALYESVLDPGAGISMGFEANQIELKSGDEAYGIITSETETELAVKDAKGILTRYKKSEIAKREQSKNSIMPTGLQATMSTQELVDLVEFLSALKKPE